MKPTSSPYYFCLVFSAFKTTLLAYLENRVGLFPFLLNINFSAYSIIFPAAISNNGRLLSSQLCVGFKSLI